MKVCSIFYPPPQNDIDIQDHYSGKELHKWDTIEEQDSNLYRKMIDTIIEELHIYHADMIHTLDEIKKIIDEHKRNIQLN